MAKNARQRAKKMAAKGKSAEQIQSRTGVSSAQANRYVEKRAPAPAASANQGTKMPYGVTNTGTPGGRSMPGGTDAQGKPIPPSQASNIYKLNVPFSTAGVTNMWGNPMDNFDTGFQIVGDGKNWQDPANAGLLAQYTNPEAINNHINSLWAMSSENPNRDANMAAFIDSGHLESLITGKAPTAMPDGYRGLYNPAMTGTSTPWSQQYAAANGGYGQSSGTDGTGVNTGGGSGGDGKNSGLRNTNKSKNHWTNYDYGKKFGGKDIKNILESGGRSGANKAMKIAQAAYAGGDVKKVNKLNKTLGELNQDWINPKTNTVYTKGQKNTYASYPSLSKQPGKVYEWNGFGNGMTRYNKKGFPGLFDGGYEKGQQWSLPTKYMNGFNPIPADDPGPATDAVDGTVTGDGDFGGGDFGGDYGSGGADSSLNTMNQGGYGDDVSNWATSWRGARGTRAKAGRRAQGTGSMTTKSPAAYAFGIGANFG